MQMILTPQQLDGKISEILANAEKEAKLRRDEFTGVSGSKVIAKLHESLGDEWVLKKDQPFKLTDADVNAVAAARFFKQKGLTYLLMWALVVSLMWMFSSIYPVIPLTVFGVLNAVAAIVFFYVYTRELKKVRRQLWNGIRGDFP